MLQNEIKKLAEAGAGMRIDCSNKLVQDLVSIAQAAKKGHGLIFLENTDKLLLNDKIRIANAGQGYIIFNDII